MAVDYETLKFLRFLAAMVALLIGAAAGYQHYGLLGALGGGLVGYVVGWNLVDLFKGRTRS